MFARLMGLKTISPGELHRRMQGEPMTVIDVNSKPSWLSARVPGALHLDPLGYRDRDLPSDKDSTLVFYCSGFLCRKAHHAARRARDMGYTQVHVMSAGISGWIDADLPTDSGADAGLVTRAGIEPATP